MNVDSYTLYYNFFFDEIQSKNNGDFLRYFVTLYQSSLKLHTVSHFGLVGSLGFSTRRRLS